jgi:ribonuclease HI
MIVFTDGACSGNGSNNSRGGFGVVVLNNDGSYHACYQKMSEGTTNNREELKAILYALLEYGKADSPLIIFSDSAYCVNTLTNWMFRWAQRGWLKADNTTPENLDIIQAFYEVNKLGYKMDLRKIKGHNGHEWNEVADKLATGNYCVEYVERKYGGR